MTITAKVLLGFLAFALLSQLWLFRFDIKPGTPTGVYVLDRWTGTVSDCLGGCVVQYPRDK